MSRALRIVLQTLLWLLVGLAILFCFVIVNAEAAGTTYHAPISTGDNSRHVGTDLLEASGVIYSKKYDRFIVITDDNQFSVYQSNGTHVLTTPNFQIDCSGDGANDMEGITFVVAPGSSEDVIWVQSENGSGMCRFDLDDVLAGTPGLCTNDGTTKCDQNSDCPGGTCEPLEELDWPTGDTDCASANPGTDAEGLMFIPDASATGCRYTGYFYAQPQNTAFVYKYCMHPTNATLDCVAQFTRAACRSAVESAALEYDWTNGLAYFNTDNADGTCIVDPDAFDTVLTTINDPTTSGRTNTFEGITFGAGKFAYVDDNTSGSNDAYNGLWLFEDSYCGDGFTSSAETCDDGNQTDNDGCEYEAGAYCTVTAGWQCSGTPSSCSLIGAGRTRRMF